MIELSTEELEIIKSALNNRIVQLLVAKSKPMKESELFILREISNDIKKVRDKVAVEVALRYKLTVKVNESASTIAVNTENQ